MEQVSQKGLVRGIGRWDLLALTINGMVGAGIFGLPSRIYGLAGVWSVVAYLVCAALVTLITLCFAEVGSRFAETGGPYLYARVAFGSVIGFEVGWLLWLARMTAFAVQKECAATPIQRACGRSRCGPGGGAGAADLLRLPLVEEIYPPRRRTRFDKRIVAFAFPPD